MDGQEKEDLQIAHSASTGTPFGVLKSEKRICNIFILSTVNKHVHAPACVYSIAIPSHRYGTTPEGMRRSDWIRNRDK